ncbi:Similar to 3-phytase B; acc. no. P34754 [Pyronema omphalodes CBS 100304]|uniref:Similar to 3-phytase B acc. no. P34754 n=1 Tax=Pyronema omphalodes (strain CBS 100304) TaxID=1076935 RepID=U4L9K9_PYROM|nr:Similar to 3-phytase B; acc. no. P34754 [Pyronema omphalodes CBS 100304]
MEERMQSCWSKLLSRMGFAVLTVSFMVCLLATVLFLLNPTQGLALNSLRFTRLQQVLPGYLQTEHKGWNVEAPITSLQNSTDDWNILYHLGGNGPWIDRLDGVVDGGVAVPSGCEVDMVHLMSRHAERYPTQKAGIRMLEMINRLKAHPEPFVGELSFLNNWTYFSDTPGQHFEQLTTTGPYAGVLEAFATGVKLATRYGHLKNYTEKAVTHVWACGCQRVIDTARHFSAGFFGLDNPHAQVITIPEDETRGGDTLTPGDTCLTYLSDLVHGHDNGAFQLAHFQTTYLPSIAERLSAVNPTHPIKPADVYAMQELCGFEMLVRGSSPWCAVFTQEDWAQFEYARDLLHYYRAGPGTPYSIAMGSLWLNATAELLLDGPEKRGSIFASFVHDGDVVPMITALGIMEEEQKMPSDRFWEQRKWKTSQVTPMGGRVIFERLSCPTGKFVRVNVNDGIIPLPGCADGPGSSCELTRFSDYVGKRREKGGDFKKVCGLSDEAPEKIDFLRQPGYER